MKLTIPTKSLRDALSRVKPAISTRVTLPILGHVRLIAGNGTLAASATNCDLWIDAQETAEGELSCCLSFSRLFSAAQSFDGETTTITRLDGCVHEITCGPSRIKLPMMDPEEYKEPGVDGFSKPVQADLLPVVLNRLIPFLSDDPTRTTSAICLRNRMAVASDGHILLEEPSGFDCVETLIPPDVAKAINGWESCEVSLNADGIRLYGKNTVVTGRLQAGQFPAYENAIPTGGMPFTLDREKLIKAVNDCIAQADSRKFDALRFSPGPDGLTVSIVTEHGEAHCTLECANLPNAAFGVSPAYLLTCLRAFSEPQITFHYTDNSTPLVIRQEGRVAVCWLMRIKL